MTAVNFRGLGVALAGIRYSRTNNERFEALGTDTSIIQCPSPCGYITDARGTRADQSHASVSLWRSWCRYVPRPGNGRSPCGLTPPAFVAGAGARRTGIFELMAGRQEPSTAPVCWQAKGAAKDDASRPCRGPASFTRWPEPRRPLPRPYSRLQRGDPPRLPVRPHVAISGQRAAPRAAPIGDDQPPRPELYAFWRAFKNLQTFKSNVQRVLGANSGEQCEMPSHLGAFSPISRQRCETLSRGQVHERRILMTQDTPARSDQHDYPFDQGAKHRKPSRAIPEQQEK